MVIPLETVQARLNRLVEAAAGVPGDPQVVSDLRALLQLGCDMLSAAPLEGQLREPMAPLDAPMARLLEHQSASEWIIRSRQLIDAADEALALSRRVAEPVAGEIIEAHERREAAQAERANALREKARQSRDRIEVQIGDLEASLNRAQGPRRHRQRASAESDQAEPEDAAARQISRHLDSLRNARDMNQQIIETSQYMTTSKPWQRDLLASITELWDAVSTQVLDAHRRRSQARRFRARIRAGIVVALALLVVFVGVFADLALGYTPAAGVVASATLACVLWGMDRRLISPRAQRAQRARLIEDLQGEIADRTEALMRIRLQESLLRQRAELVDVTCPSLLGDTFISSLAR
jgi:hypothetical protein